MPSSINRCYLLELPRELRDLIYEYIHKECELIDDADQSEHQSARAHMLNGPQPQMFRVCQQIRQEYAKVTVLGIELALKVRRMRVTDFHLKPGPVCHWMRAAVSCTVRVTWAHLMPITRQGLCRWWIAVHNEPEEQTLQRSWTPSIQAAQILAGTLETLSQVLNEDCQVTMIVEFPTTPGNMEARRQARHLQPPVYRSLMENPHIPFSRKGNLKVVFTMETPLYEYRIRKNVAYDRWGFLASFDYTAHKDYKSKIYVTAPSREMVEWTLFPCGDLEAHLPTFCGFYPLAGVVVGEQ